MPMATAGNAGDGHAGLHRAAIIAARKKTDAKRLTRLRQYAVKHRRPPPSSETIRLMGNLAHQQTL